LPRFIRANGGYIFSLFPELVRYQARRVTLTCLDDDRPRALAEPATLIAFANGPRYGRGLQIAPQATMSDGLLDICFVRRISKLKVLTLFPIVYFGRHLSLPEVEYFRCRRVRVETESPTDIYADGDFLCQTPAEISIVPAALRVIAPELS
jgi:diacylglycerol kinase family enzyme